MIKKYDGFILEMAAIKPAVVDHYIELKNKKSIIETRDTWAKKIKSLSDYYDNYFSELASNHNLNVDDDFKEMQSLMDKTGFTIEVIKKLFSKEVCELTHEYFPFFIRKNRLDEINGYVDVYLYKIYELIYNHDGWKPQLGGWGWSEDALSTPEEVIIKYEYGYHKTSYGRLLLDKIDVSETEFLNKVSDSIWNAFIEENLPKNSSKIFKIISEEEDLDLVTKRGDYTILNIYLFWSMFDEYITSEPSIGKVNNFEDFRSLFNNFLKSKKINIIEEDEIITKTLIN